MVLGERRQGAEGEAGDSVQGAAVDDDTAMGFDDDDE